MGSGEGGGRIALGLSCSLSPIADSLSSTPSDLSDSHPSPWSSLFRPPLLPIFNIVH
jgi:hypothetical protein